MTKQETWMAGTEPGHDGAGKTWMAGTEPGHDEAGDVDGRDGARP
jgi:hypothetical protein